MHIKGMNLFVLFGDGKKKMTETLHHALHTMMQFPVFFFGGGGGG
jgi:hypothetical protein